MAMISFMLLVSHLASVSAIFSTKTPYKQAIEMSAGSIEALAKFKLDNSICQVAHVSALYRHGTRYPKLKNFNKMKLPVNKLLEQRPDLRPLFYNDSLAFSLDFFNAANKELFMMLSEIGAAEFSGLADRFYLRFAPYLSAADSIDVQVTKKQRTLDSASNFTTRLASRLAPDALRPARVADDVLRFFDNCPKYINEIDDSDVPLDNFHAFLQSSFMHQTARRFERRLRLAENSMKPEEIYYIYVYFGFFSALNNDLTAYKQFFSADDIVVLEYLDDVKTYWVNGHGYDLTGEQSCVLLEDIFKPMQRVVDGKADDSVPDVVLRFAHAETLMPLVNLLDIFVDSQPLNASTFDPIRSAERQFRGSHVSPFAANMVFVLYQCAEAAGGERHLVQLLFNEQPLALPFCRKAPAGASQAVAKEAARLQLCAWSDFARWAHQRTGGRCDLATLCHVGEAAATFANLSLLAVTLLLGSLLLVLCTARRLRQA